MVKDRIVVFNRLTDSRLADCSLFEDLLENHYQHFIQAYDIISLNNLIDKVDDITCKTKKDQLELIISFKKKIDDDVEDIIATNISEAATQTFTVESEVHGTKEIRLRIIDSY